MPCDGGKCNRNEKPEFIFAFMKSKIRYRIKDITISDEPYYQTKFEWQATLWYGFSNVSLDTAKRAMLEERSNSNL